MKLKEEIKVARVKKNLSQRELANLLGVTQQMVSAWEKGEPMRLRCKRIVFVLLFDVLQPVHLHQFASLILPRKFKDFRYSTPHNRPFQCRSFCLPATFR